jgi:hypothetical protein
MPKRRVTGQLRRAPRVFRPVATELRAAGLSNRERRAASMAKLRARLARTDPPQDPLR